MLRLVLEEIATHIKCIDVDDETILLMEKYLIDAEKVFICGFGESELVGKSFASRLSEIRRDVYVVSDTIVPEINEGNILIAISGSGETEPTLTITKKAREIGAKIISITSFNLSPLAQISDLVIEIPGRIKAKTKNYIERQVAGEYEPLTPFGTLFEISTRIFLEGIIAELANKEDNL
ncbi:MAG: SIS domain-containing protein [Methanobacterium sp.]|uniref:SIS domain-containing protein n=1 Tax=Methanobacterium sp. TaxID=2164 RepID=UPI003D65A845|nr:SIS domain-containing protein [Methanobacterium sp.]